MFLRRDNGAYVNITSFASGFAAYSSEQAPTLRASGGLALLSGSVKNTAAFTPGPSGRTMFTIPAGYRPAQAVRAVCQGSGVYRYLLVVDTDGSVICARYGDTTNVEASSGSWFVLDAAWVIA